MFGDRLLDELEGASESEHEIGIPLLQMTSSHPHHLGAETSSNPQDDLQASRLLPLTGEASVLDEPPPAAASNSTVTKASSVSSQTPPAASPPKNLFRSRKVKRNRKSKSGPGTPSCRTGGITVASDRIIIMPTDEAPSPRSDGTSKPHRCAVCSCTSSNLRCMNCVARVLLWLTMVSMAAAVVWYSYELFNHGTDPHLIAWFSAGAFVLMGFPISMWGIVSHLANYNQPHVQVYVVRVLWMVPIYSIESWLAMRFHKQAIYIETLRDLYESYVLYSFLQFLIQVLGGEQALILMLKDKSPTRGVHMWGFQWCMKPWLMGQPVRKTVFRDDVPLPPAVARMHPSSDGLPAGPAAMRPTRAVKRVHWKSPFFINCKFGVLQYVLLKFLCAVVVLVLEYYAVYKEGDFDYRGGYLYVCIITNLSQCWALYCLIFFYYATKTELSPIRPVGKFLSVKSLVFFTWWQSVFISGLYQMGVISSFSYQDWTPEEVAKAIQDYIICIEMFLAAVVHTFVFPHAEYSPQAVEARRRALNQIPMTTKKRLGRQHHHYAYSAAAASRGPLWHAGIRADDVSKGSSDYNNNNTARDLEMATFASANDGANSVNTAETWDDLHQQYYHHHQFGSPLGGVPSNPSYDSDQQVLLQPTESWEMAAEDQIMMPLPSSKGAPFASHTSAIVEETESDKMRNESNHYEDYDDSDEVSSSMGDDGDVERWEDNGESERIGLLSAPEPSQKPGFVSALIDSAIPIDLRDNTVGIVKGDYRIERKTLLHHAATSDQYDLFSQRRPFRRNNNSGGDSIGSGHAAPGIP